MIESQISTIEAAIDEGDLTYAHLTLEEMRKSIAHRKLRRIWRKPNQPELAEEISSMGERLQDLIVSLPSRITSQDPELETESALDLFGLIATNFSFSGLDSEIRRIVKEDFTPATLVRYLSIPKISPTLNIVVDSMHLLLTEAQELEEGQAWIFSRLMKDKGCDGILASLWNRFSGEESITEQSAKMLAMVDFLRHKDLELTPSWPLSMLVKRFHPEIHETLEKALSAKYLDKQPNHSIYQFILPLHRWAFEQPPAVRELLFERMFILGVIDLSDVVGMLLHEEVEVPEESGPLCKSIIWLAQFINRIEDECDWKPNGLYYYENMVGIVTDPALWEVEMEAPSSVGEPWGVKVVCHRPGHVGDVCVDAVANVAWPIGDRVMALVLACWNDEETAKRVDTFAEAIGLPIPKPDPNDVICPNCGDENIYYEAGGGHDNCQCQYTHTCPTCTNWSRTPGECFTCRVDHH
jgi:hypothetical protein